MFKRRGSALIVISLGLALGAAWIARGWVHSRLNGGKSETAMSVVVAATEIPFGISVESRHLRIIALPEGSPIGDHFSKPDEVVGLVALQKVLPGEILLKQQFATQAAGSTLAAVLKPNMRAMAVRVDDVVGVAGFLLPGNHVDVVEARLVDQRALTQTVARDINVLAVDQTDSHDKSSPVLVRAVTLEVTSEEAEILVKAMTEGRIQLTLRSPMAPHDSTIQVAQAPPPPPPPLPRKAAHRVRVLARPAPDDAITVIRGTDVQKTHGAT